MDAARENTMCSGEGPGSAAAGMFLRTSPAAAQSNCPKGCSLYPTSSHGPWAGGPQLPPAPTLLLLGQGQRAKASSGSGAQLRAVAHGCSSSVAMLWHPPRLYSRGRTAESGEEAPCSRTGSPVDWC